MAIKQKLTLTTPVGTTFVTVNEWAKVTLLAEELPLFEAAQQRHNDFIASKANSVDLENGEIVFADESKKNEADPLNGDMDFLIYWYRYLQDTGITVQNTVENI